MKLCRYWLPGSGATLGIVEGEMVYDLARVDPEVFGSLSGMLRHENLSALAIQAAGKARPGSGLPYEELDIAPDAARPHLLPPVTEQEVWAAGVTYTRSRQARMEESVDGGSFYDKVYNA